MLPRKHRLTTRYEFGKVKRDGVQISSSLFHIYYLKRFDSSEPTKIGIVLSNKFSKVAPERNHFKRQLREIVRSNFGKIKSGYWIVIYPKFNIKKSTYEEINLEFIKTLQKVPFSREF